MKKYLLGILLAFCMLVCFAPAAMAQNNRTDIADNSMPQVYVSSATATDPTISKGNDETGQGTIESPFASLSLAVDKVTENGTIYLLTDLTSTKYAIVHEKDIIIDGQGHTITRGDNFTPQNDARGGYNPAMIEVANHSTLTLQNITLDDAFKTEGTEFELAGDSSDGNEKKVHDGIIASYGDGKATIILDKDTTLKNFGGLSAVYITGEKGNGATFIMKNGSKICDDSSAATARKGGYAAIYNHGGTVTMDEGSSIEDIYGRAIYIDNAGMTTVNGLITDITSNEVMKLYNGNAGSGFGGIVSYVDGNANFVLGSTGHISNIKSHNDDKVDVAFHLQGGTLKTEKNSEITEIDIIGLVDSNGGTIDIAGNITNCHTQNVFFRMRGGGDVKFLLQKDGRITQCSTTDVGIIYRNGGKLSIFIDGIIRDVQVGSNFDEYVIYNSNNNSVAGGICTITGTITKISGNGIYIKDPSTVTITGEISECTGYALHYKPEAPESTVNIEPGCIIRDNNQGGSQIYVEEYAKDRSANTFTQRISIAKDNVTLSNRDITLDDLTITLSSAYGTLKLGNVNLTNETKLTDTSQKKGWGNQALASFWVESETAQEITLSEIQTNINDTLPLYALVMETESNGSISDGMASTVYTVNKNGDDSFTLNLPATGKTGWAVALVQPSEDYGILSLTANPDTLTEGKSDTIHYTTTYKPSNNLMSQLNQNDKFTLTITLPPDMEYVESSGNGLSYNTNDHTLTMDFAADQLNGEFTVSFSATVDGSTLSAGDILITNAELSGNATAQGNGITININATTTMTVEPKPQEPDQPTPPYIPPVEPTDPDYTPDGLDTENHFSYIIGYEDGTVKPNASITRAEVATIFFRLLTDEARDQFWSQSNDYTDVSQVDWFNNAVSTLSNMGILSGYEDDTFRPKATITRAEFAKIAVSFFDYESIEADNVFTDVAEGTWYENYVAVAAEIGLIEGYDGNIFRPEASITRAEACTIINRTLGRAPDKDHLLPQAEMNTWPDNSNPDAWYYEQIQEATNSHDYRWIGNIEQWTAKLEEPHWDELQH